VILGMKIEISLQMAKIVHRSSAERTEMLRTNITQQMSDRHNGTALLKREMELMNTIIQEQYYAQLKV